MNGILGGLHVSASRLGARDIRVPIMYVLMCVCVYW